jgi:hypothetical protein
MKNAWGIEPKHLGQEGSLHELPPHAMLEKAVKEAISILELAQHSKTNAQHGRLLAWEALDILRTALRSIK